MTGKAKITYLITGIVVAGAAVTGCSSYNSLVDNSEGVDNAWAKVETQYQRRLDLIPNLVEVVKGYSAHEKSTLENVTLARAGLDNALNDAKNAESGDMNSDADFQRYTNAQRALNQQCGIYVNAVREAYPDLKANDQFRDLQVQLEGTENRITYARNKYTEIVNKYNKKVRKFPSNIIASLFGFKTKPQYSAEKGAEKAPKVSFQ